MTGMNSVLSKKLNGAYICQIAVFSLLHKEKAWVLTRVWALPGMIRSRSATVDLTELVFEA